MYLTMYPALAFIDMSVAGAAFYTAPFFIVALSALFLGQLAATGASTGGTSSGRR
ncbi:hypothetical protein [Paracoccus mutanolyticus]|uniref:hypothetical protein n=1 Tax=Paracoccus mutanolyticus TaxID=1499308 RepID=UPI001672B31B|nr:hypothetical protein [Paracoccus mutanolyticus]